MPYILRQYNAYDQLSIHAQIERLYQDPSSLFSFPQTGCVGSNIANPSSCGTTSYESGPPCTTPEAHTSRDKAETLHGRSKIVEILGSLGRLWCCTTRGL